MLLRLLYTARTVYPEQRDIVPTLVSVADKNRLYALKGPNIDILRLLEFYFYISISVSLLKYTYDDHKTLITPTSTTSSEFL